MITKEAIELSKILWNYLHINNKLEKSDCILVLGSHDTRVAERAAELFLEGWAPLLIFSGGLGRLTEEVWEETEADKFSAIAKNNGVPESAILIENRSTNTGDNILFTQALLKNKNLDPASFIVVQKPYALRRSYATFKKQWPNKKLLMTSQQITFEQYPNDNISIENVINIMVGDLQRIKLYPDKGFQIYQEIPDEVWKAYNQLIELGFNKELLS
jgi:uncharacterized SAM-binding protein YcdF (DUF218 family)